MLICALVHSIFDPAAPPPAQPPKTAKTTRIAQKVKKAAVHAPIPRRNPHPIPPAAAAVVPPAPTEVPAAAAEPVESTAVPRSEEPSPAEAEAAAPGYAQLPGSAAIEENTRHFAPVAGEQR